jgi:hypothetical protein|mmetsp:Transcript_69706/g.155353  ORF Transcript_69706/g.155353 Transcript_69706/m.155353 type:complete len:258 (-) Transcript_69706:177-950(-)
MLLSEAPPERWCGHQATIPCFSLDDHLLIYTRGRCGSTSLQLALRRALGIPRLPYVPSIQPHYPPRAKIHTREVATSYMQHIPSNTTLWLVILVRNPFDRSQSIFFQNLARHMGGSLNYSQAQLAVRFTGLAPELTRGILETLPSVLGRSIESPTYNASTRDAWLVAGSVRLLILRAEDSAYWPNIVRRRLGLEITLPEYHNVGARKWFGSVYKELKAHYAFSRKVVAHALATDDMRRLYSEQERMSMARRALHPRP